MKKLSVTALLLSVVWMGGEVLAKTRAPNTKRLVTKLMQHERSNFKQLMASEQIFLHDSLLLQGMDRLEQITPQYIDRALGVTRRLVSTRLGVIADVQDISFDALYTPLEEIDVYIEKIWNPIVLAASLVRTDEKRLPKAFIDTSRDYLHWIKQQVLLDETVFQKLLALKESEILTADQRRVVEIKLEEMQGAGIMLSEGVRSEVYVIRQRIADLKLELRNVYSTESNKIVLLLTQKEDVAGLPESFLQWAAKNFAAKGGAASASADEGPWLIDLRGYNVFMSYSTRRDLRASFYHSLITMTKDGEYDKLIREILHLRKKIANIFGAENYTDYVMSTRMIKDSSEIEALMAELHQAILPSTKRGYESLAAYAYANEHEGEIEPYDVYFWRKKLAVEQIGKINPKLLDKRDDHASLKSTLPDVMQGVFVLAHKLFGIKIEKYTEQAAWHPDVSFYHVYDESGDHIGSFYLDPYRRSGKRGGAWVKSLSVRGSCEIAQNVPVCYMATNLKPPEENKTALLMPPDVKTFLHEFGHVLQHVLTKTDYHMSARVNDQDMVELSSKLMEKFLLVESLARDVLSQNWADFIMQMMNSANAGESIPLSAAAVDMKELKELFIIRADLELHRSYDPDGEESPADFLRQIAAKIRITPTNPSDEFSDELIKILAISPYENPYAYIYKLGQIMASDVFELFKENGVDDESLRTTGQLLWDKFLAAGGSRPALELLKELRGRPLTAEAYLKEIEKLELLVD